MAALTKTQLLAALARLAQGGRDPEGNHADADEALLAFIDDPEVRAAYEAIQPKWYA